MITILTVQFTHGKKSHGSYATDQCYGHPIAYWPLC